MKTIEIFKTNVQNNMEADRIIASLISLYPVYKINFDLEDEENIFRIEVDRQNIEVQDIIRHVTALGYSCERIV